MYFDCGYVDPMGSDISVILFDLHPLSEGVPFCVGDINVPVHGEELVSYHARLCSQTVLFLLLLGHMPHFMYVK